MRINEILVESQQLDEGPLGSLGKAVGKGVGGVAKGVGAVAGGIAGIPGAVKKGFQAGKATVQGDEPAAGTAPSQAQANLAKTGNPVGAPSAAPAAKKPGLLQKIGQAAGDFKKGFQQGSGQTAEPETPAPAAKASAPAATAQAPATTSQQQAPAPTGTAYAQVKANIDKLDKKGKQRILQALQKQLGTPAAKPAAGQQQAPAPQAAPEQPINPATGKPLTDKERQAHQAAGGQFDGETGAPLPLGTQATNTSTDFEKKVADLKAKRDAEKAAVQKQPAQQAAPKQPAASTQPSTGQAAIAAANAGEDPEQAALAAMQKKNPNLKKLAARSNQPVKISGKKKAAAPQQQMASKEPKGTMVAEGFSIFRKR